MNLLSLIASLFEVTATTDVGRTTLLCNRSRMGGSRRPTEGRSPERLVRGDRLMERVCVLLHVEEGGTKEAARATALVMPVFERWKDSTR
jgi:hypothetical protein